MNVDRSPSTVDRVPAALRAGRRALDGLRGVEVFDDFAWLPTLGAWAIGVRLTIDAPGPRRLGITSWYLVVKEAYPWGGVNVFPALEGGIADTFPHQRYSQNQEGLPFRTGGLCVRSGLQSIDRRSLDQEPLDPHQRLRWTVERVRAWTIAASGNELVLPGEPFEVPDFPIPDARRDRLAFSETPESFAAWSGVSARCGTLRLVGSLERSIFHVLSFDSETGDVLVAPNWGTFIQGMKRARRGLWIRLDSVPVLDPWKAPSTWGELRDACDRIGVDLDPVLRRLAQHVRDGVRHLALIGFPIPKRFGEGPSQLRWQGLLLPELARRPGRGFRAGERSLWLRDRFRSFGPDMKIDWMTSENWSMEDLTSRGALPQAVCEQRVLLLGAGALGSVVAELLVRGGVTDLVVVDDDELEAGNLVRHTLTLLDVGKPKALALAERLNTACPHARVRGFKARFPALGAEARALAEGRTLVLDCTASDQVAHHELENFSWGGPRIFASLSLGFDARRMFCFTTVGERFPSTTFIETTRPWLLVERGENAGRELPREGVGCWNPAFPARLDDIWALAGLGLKQLARVVGALQPSPELVVFQGTADGYARAVMPA